MYAGEIASELDKSYQLIGQQREDVAERGLVNRNVNDQSGERPDRPPLAESSYLARLAMTDWISERILTALISQNGR